MRTSTDLGICMNYWQTTQFLFAYIRVTYFEFEGKREKDEAVFAFNSIYFGWYPADNLKYIF